jgi:hypothetical protein
MIARRDHDSKALSDAMTRGRALGMSQASLNQIGRQDADVYQFSRLPNEDQKAILLDATREQRNRYWPKAHQAVRAQLNQQLHLPAQTPAEQLESAQ